MVKQSAAAAPAGTPAHVGWGWSWWMVFSFAVAILTASRSISRDLAFAIFVGTTSLHGHLAAAFTPGLHAAFYTLMTFMVLAGATRARAATSAPRHRRGRMARSGSRIRATRSYLARGTARTPKETARTPTGEHRPRLARSARATPDEGICA